MVALFCATDYREMSVEFIRLHVVLKMDVHTEESRVLSASIQLERRI